MVKKTKKQKKPTLNFMMVTKRKNKAKKKFKMIPPKIKKHGPILNWVSKTNPKQAKAFIKTADKGFIDALCECCLNVLHGNIPLSNKQKKKLKKHKTTLRQLVNKKISITRKKALLQKGGSLGGIISSLGGLLGGLLFGGKT